MATRKKFGRIVALILTLVMMLSIVPFQSFAAEAVDPTEVELKNGKAAISSDMTDDQIKKVLFDNLVANPEGKNYQDYEWQYYCEGKNTEVYKFWDWATIKGEVKWANPPGIVWQEDYHFPALKDNGNRDWQVRLVGGTQEATLTKVAACTLDFEYDNTQGNVFANGLPVKGTVGNFSPVASTQVTVEPLTGYNVASVTVNGTALEADNGVYEFVPVADTKIEVKFSETEGQFNTVTLPEVPGVTFKVNGFDAKGDFRVNNTEESVVEFITDSNTSIDKVIVNGEDVTDKVEFADYNGTYKAVITADTTIQVITVKSAIALTGDTVVPVIAHNDGSWDYAQIENAIVDTLIDRENSTIGNFANSEIDVQYNFKNVAPEEYAPIDFNATLAWQVSFRSLTENGGEAKIRLEFAGNNQYRPAEVVYKNITVNDLPGSTLAVRSGVQNFTLFEVGEGVYGYEALRQAIYKAVIDEANSTPAGAVSYDKVKITYKILDGMGSSVGIGAGKFYDFEQGWLGADAAGTYRYMYKGGKFTIKVELPSTDTYYGTSVEFDVNVKVEGLPTANIALKDYDKNFNLYRNYDRSYNYDALKAEIYDRVIDALASTPEGAVTEENVKFTYQILDGMGTSTGIGAGDFYDFAQGWLGADAAGTYKYMYKGGQFTVRATVANTDSYYGSSVEFPINVTIVDNSTAQIIIDNTKKDFVLEVAPNHTMAYDALKEALFNAVVKEVKNVPGAENLTWEDFTFEYLLLDGMGTTTGADTGFGAFERGQSGWDAAGTYRYLYNGGSFTFKLILADGETYYGTSAEFDANVTIKDLPETSMEAKAGQKVVLNINKDRTYDYDGLKEAIFNQIITVNNCPADLTWEDLKFEFKIYDDGAAIKTWVPFETRRHASDSAEILYHYLYQGGKFDFRATLADGNGYYGSNVYFSANVVVEDKYTTKIALKDNFSKDFTLYYKNANDFDYDRLRKDLFEAVIDTANSSANVTFDNVIFSYDVTDGMAIHYPDAPFETVGSDYSDPAETLFTYLHDGGTFTFKFAVPTSGGLFGTSVSVSLTVKPFVRTKSSVVLNGNAKMDYVADPDVVKQYIFDNVISKELSILPEGVTVNDFTFEYYAKNYTAGGVPGVEQNWVPFEGMKHPTLAGSYYKAIGAGDHYYRVRYNGSAAFEPSGWTSGWEIISLPRSEFDISLSQNYIYRKDDLPGGFIKVSENAQGADINYRMLFTTTTNQGNTLVYLQTRDGYSETDFTLWLNPVITDVFGADWTALGVLQNGLTIDQYKQLINSQRLYEHFQYWYGFTEADMATFRTAALSRLGGMKHVEFRLGTPTHAAHYDMFVAAYNESFYTETMHTGFDVKYNSRGKKLIWREDATGLNTINSKTFDFGADVTVDGHSQSDGNVKYLYTGFFYCSSQAPRGKSGFFIQTAWTKVGTTYCFPQTRSFNISIL